MKIRLIACEVIRKEFEHLISSSANEVHPLFLEKGLHDLGAAPMRNLLQKAIDDTEQSFDLIALGYGLCNNGLVGIVARHTTLVVPRAHDCITLLLGSRGRYEQYFEQHPGTYFLSVGWIEHGETSEQLRPQTIPSRLGLDLTLEQLIEKYGEEEGRYVYEALRPARHYQRIAFIETVGDALYHYESVARERAARNGWYYEQLSGDLRLMRGLLDGPWNEEEFLIVPPGQTIQPDYGSAILRLGGLPSS